MVKNLLVWVVIVSVAIFVLSNFNPPHHLQQKLPYSEFLKQVQDGSIQEVSIEERDIMGKSRSHGLVKTYIPLQDPFLLNDLLKAGVSINGKPPRQPSLLLSVFINWFPMLLLIGVWVFFMRQMQGGWRPRCTIIWSKSSTLNG